MTGTISIATGKANGGLLSLEKGKPRNSGAFFHRVNFSVGYLFHSLLYGTWMDNGVLKKAPVESQACTTTECVPVASAKEVSSELAFVANLEILST
jgi:hypothetical protein